MKTAANTFSAAQSEPSTSQPPATARWEGTRYLLVGVILATVALLVSLLPEDPTALSFQVGPGFFLFWLAGGSITLILLTRAAKKPI